MDLKTLFTTFGLIFLAELGDKTQLMAISLVSSTRKGWEVFIGASLAMTSVTALGVIFGQGILKIVPQPVIHYVAGGLFVLAGVLMLLGKV